MDTTLLRQFRQAVSLASLAFVFSAIHAIQYSLLDSDYDMEDHPQETSHSDTSTHADTSNPAADTSSNSEKASASGRWTDQEISRLLDYVEANCPTNASNGVSLKKTHFNKASDTVKSKNASQCHYKWGHVCISSIIDEVYLTDSDFILRKLCGIYKAISLWDKKSGSAWHDIYGVNARTVAEKQVLDEWLKTPDVS